MVFQKFYMFCSFLSKIQFQDLPKLSSKIKYFPVNERAVTQSRFVYSVCGPGRHGRSSAIGAYLLTWQKAQKSTANAYCLFTFGCSHVGCLGAWSWFLEKGLGFKTWMMFLVGTVSWNVFLVIQGVSECFWLWLLANYKTFLFKNTLFISLCFVFSYKKN